MFITQSRAAGAAYVSIILLGLSAEFALRGPLIDPANAAATANAIRSHLELFRLSILADAGMALMLGQSGLAPRWLLPLLGGAALVYVAGSVTRIIAPEINGLIQPAYLVPVIAETAFALALLLTSRRIAQPA